MIDDKADPLERALIELPRLAPSEARSARIHARCTGLYGVAQEPKRQAPGGGTWLFGFLSVIYLFELSRLAVRLSFLTP